MRLSLKSLLHLLNESIDEFVDDSSMETDEVVDILLSNIKQLSDLTYVNMEETDDYVTINLNSSNPETARKELASYKFSHATNLILDVIKRSRGNGYRLAVYDNDGNPFDKDIVICIRKGGQYNAGVSNEMDFQDIVQNAIDDSGNIIFIDSDGTQYKITDMESVRDCGKDPGSRMGNRGDVEITTADGNRRISLKKNTAYKAAGLVRRFAKESYSIGKSIRKQFIKNGIPFTNRYITVEITNPELYRWCLFGNDIGKKDAVIKSAFSSANIKSTSSVVKVSVDEIMLPTMNDETLMEKFPLYMFMQMNKQGTVNILAAVFGSFGKRYEMENLVVPNVND